MATLKQVFTDIANAIRNKKGTDNKIKPNDMATEIESISTGIEPIGTLEITENGEYDVKQYANANVNVASSGGEGTVKALLDYIKSCNRMFYQNTDIVDLTGYLKFDDTSNVTDMYYMFYSCSNLTTMPQLDTSKVTNTGGMFQNCSNLTTIPQLDTSKVTSMYGMFGWCSNLTTIPQLDTSNVINMSSMFNSCRSLTDIDMFGMKVSFDIHWSTLLSREVLIKIFNNCQTVTTTQTLTLGSTLLAKLTDEDKAIITEKGWTLK